MTVRAHSSCGLFARSLLLVLACATVSRADPPSTWHAGHGFRWTELPVPAQGKTGFTLLEPAQTGLAFTNLLLETSAASNRILENGAGVALGDFDGDGRLDIFVCGLDSSSELYRNLGNWRFTNVTSAAGLRFAGPYQRGAVFADVNGDGALDLLVSTLDQGVLCFINDGHGHFRDSTRTAGTATRFGSLTLALADVDGNGTLDLYVANYRPNDIRSQGNVQVYRRNGQYVIPPDLTNRLTVLNGVVREMGDPDVLYLNDGQGHFTPVSWTDGRFRDAQGHPLQQPPRDWGQTASFRDLNGDGAPDLYVCNDFWTVDRLWLNDGHGSFRAIDSLALRHVCFSSMGVDFADINRDGFLDFLVTDMQSRDPRLRKRQIFAFNPDAPPFDPMNPPNGVAPDLPQVMRNTLFVNRGDNTFADLADFAGVASAEWAWQQLFLDVDLDGYEDLLVAAGFYRDVQDRDAINAAAHRPPDLRGLNSRAAQEKAFAQQRLENSRLFPNYVCPVLAFRNLGNLRFVETTSSWGTDHLGVHQGFAMGDLDNDGDLDLVANDLNGPLAVYRNDSAAARVAVRVRGRPPNTQAIGARIKLLDGAVPMQSQEIVCGGRYLSGSDPMIVFAAGAVKGGMRLEVTWRSGHTSVVSDVGANRLYEVEEPDAGAPISTSGAATKPVDPRPAPLFQEVTERLLHVDRAEPFDDRTRQPLLPRKLSQLGPAVAWWDFDGDGHDDLVIGTGKGGSLAIYLGDGRGRFRPATNLLSTAAVPADVTGLLGWTPKAGAPAGVLAGLANDEDANQARASVIQYSWGAQQVDAVAAGAVASVGPLALADADGNGGWELFVGGRVVPGRWPEATASRIYRFENGSWVLDEPKSRALANAGMVSGAVWSDLDQDGRPELVLACEWGPIRVFGGASNAFHERTSELGLMGQTGWWNGVTTADLDGDGRLDIIASNWGLNSSYRASVEHPVRVYFGDFGGRGTMDIIEAEFEPELGGYAPRRDRDRLSESLPFLLERFPTHRAYSQARIEEVLADHLAQARTVEATALASTVFLNRGDHFEAVPLPDEAQFAPAFAVVAADFNGDGNEDVFLSQNFFENAADQPRCDAGRGLLLLGDGTGRLRAMPGQESGIEIYQEQRGAAAADFNEDGRTDLVVAQNGSWTRLLQNRGAKPGLRVRLVGPPGNPRGIGAVLRFRTLNGAGPAREIHAGSGYLGQDSAVQVMVPPDGAKELEVRWPGGRVSRVPVPAGARELTVSAGGNSDAVSRLPAASPIR